MIRWLAVGAALVSIAAIGLVLRWGTTGRAGTPPFELAVSILGIAAPLASILLTWALWRDRHRGGALLSSSPLGLMLIGMASALLGNPPSLRVLLWLDAYVLFAFVVVLLWFGRGMLRASRFKPEGTPASRQPPAA